MWQTSVQLVFALIWLLSAEADNFLRFSETISKTVTDSVGNWIVVGETRVSTSTMVMDQVFQVSVSRPNGRVSNNTALIISKFSSGGKRLWMFFIDGLADVTFGSLTLDSKDNIILSGLHDSSLTIHSTRGTEESTLPNLNNNTNAFFAKFTRNGTLLWAWQAEHTPNFVRSCLTAIDLFDNLIVSIQRNAQMPFSMTSTFGSSMSIGVNRRDVSILKFSPNGTYLWYVSSELTNGVSITTDSKGDIYAAIQYTTMVTDAKFTSQNGSTSTLPVNMNSPSGLVKFSFNGMFQWVAFRNSSINELDCDENDNVYATGSSSSDAFLFYDGAPLSSVRSEINRLGPSTFRTSLLSKYNSNGILQWVAQQSGMFTETYIFPRIFYNRRSKTIQVNLLKYTNKGATLFFANPPDRNISLQTPGFTGSILAEYHTNGTCLSGVVFDSTTVQSHRIEFYEADRFGSVIFGGRTDAVNAVFNFKGKSLTLQQISSGAQYNFLWRFDTTSAFLDLTDQIPKRCSFLAKNGLVQFLSYEMQPLSFNISMVSQLRSGSETSFIFHCDSSRCFVSADAIEVARIDRNLNAYENIAAVEASPSWFTCRTVNNFPAIVDSIGSLRFANMSFRVLESNGFRHYLHNATIDNFFFRIRSPDRYDYAFGFETSSGFLQFFISATGASYVIDSFESLTVLPVDTSKRKPLIAATFYESALKVFLNGDELFSKQLSAANVSGIFVTTRLDDVLFDNVALIINETFDLALLEPIYDPLDEIVTSTDWSKEIDLMSTTTILNPQISQTTETLPTNIGGNVFSLFGLSGWKLIAVFAGSGTGALLITSIIGYSVLRLILNRKRLNNTNNYIDQNNTFTMNTKMDVEKNQPGIIDQTLVNMTGYNNNYTFAQNTTVTSN